MAQIPANLDGLAIADLEQLVRHHNHLYWDLNAPEVPDPDYDRVVSALKKQAPLSPVLLSMGPSPSRLGNAVRHSAVMLSLDKCYSHQELKDWLTTFEGPVVAMPKIDGMACSLHYNAHGQLFMAATRGDGAVGDDVTPNALHIKDIPHRIALNQPVEVRGEVYMKLSVFQRFKAEGMANPRNLTAGAIKLKDAQKSAAYGLSFFAYELLGTPLDSQTAHMQRLKELGFAALDHLTLSQEDAVRGYEQYAAQRSTLDYEIDGVVYKTDRVSEQKRLGKTAHHPRYALAYKFQGDSGHSILRQIEWSVARTGAITPVALVDPVALSGVTVGRASLHHAGFITKLGLTLGAEVLMMRRGGVIPNVESVVTPGTVAVDIPSVCPACGSPTRFEKDFLFCSTPSTCKAAVLGRLGHFAAALDMLGFGDVILEQAYDANLIRTPVDFYTVTAEQLATLERCGDKTAQKLVAEVNKKRSLDLATFLRALGIDELGKHVSALLANRLDSLNAVLVQTEEDLAQMHGVGESIARSVVAGLKEQAPLIERLRQHITITAAAHAAAAQDGPWKGKSFVFTGKMAQLDRKEAETMVRKLGGAAADSVSKTLTYLVVGDQKTAEKSTKQKAAEKHNNNGGTIQVISETTFLDMAAEARAAG